MRSFPDDGGVELIFSQMGGGDNLLFGWRWIKALLKTLVERPLNQWIFFQNPPLGLLAKFMTYHI